MATKRGYSTTHKKSKDNKTHNGKKNVECYVCQERGHYTCECPQRKSSAQKTDRSKNCALMVCEKPSKCREQGDIVPVDKVWEPSPQHKRALLETDQSDVWFSDSGASAHINNRREWLVEYRSRRDGSTVVLGDGRECAVIGERTVLVDRLVDGDLKNVRMENVLYVPKIGKNLYSVGQATLRNISVNFEKDTVKFVFNRELMAIGVKQNNCVYHMFFHVNCQKCEVNVATVDLITWHERLGHLHERALREITSKGIVDGVTIKGSDQFFCESCQFGKAHKATFKKQVK